MPSVHARSGYPHPGLPTWLAVARRDVPTSSPVRGLLRTVGHAVAAHETAGALSSPGAPPHSLGVRAASPRGAGSDGLVPYAGGTAPDPHPVPGVCAFDGTRCGPWTTCTTRARVTSVLAQLDPPG